MLNKDINPLYFQELLRRINKNKSSYNILKWEEEFKRKEKLMRSMSEFPQFYDEREKTVSLKKQEKIYKLPDIVEMQQSASKCKNYLFKYLVLQSTKILSE